MLKTIKTKTTRNMSSLVKIATVGTRQKSEIHHCYKIVAIYHNLWTHGYKAFCVFSTVKTPPVAAAKIKEKRKQAMFDGGLEK